MMLRLVITKSWIHQLSRKINQMLIIDCFGKNIYIEDEMVGYITENQLMISGRKFADITDDGIISFGPKRLGYVDDDGTIIINEREVGYIDGDNNFIFYKSFANLSK